MKSLLAGTFVFFGIHTLLWFPRSLQVRRERNRHDRAGGAHADAAAPPSGEES
jgi:hypothetical protein